jgi:thiol-disulfide isomerase/thioredoxin
MRLKWSVLFFFTGLVFPLEVSSQEVANQGKVLKMLSEASRANRSLFGHGRIQASVRHSYYDEKGQKNREAAYEVRAVFKGDKVRLDIKGHGGNHEKTWRTVTTEETFKEYFEGETDAYLRNPKAAGIIDMLSDFLPSRNTAFWHVFLEYADDVFVSRKIINKNVADKKVCILEIVYKKRPKALDRYHLDLAKGGSVVKFESYHDFGEGHVLLRQDEAKMQPASNGGWYLRRFSSVSYRKDGTLRRKKEIEIKNFNFTFEVMDAEFTWEAMGLPKGTKIRDTRLGINYMYDGPSVQKQEKIGSTKSTKPQQEIPQQAKVLLEAIRTGKSFRDRVRSLYALMNKPAPELDVARWIQSRPLRLADLRDKIVVLDFWAIDCGPCLGDIEGLNKIHERGTSAPLIVIGVHQPVDDISEVERVMAKYKVKYPVCIDSEGGLKGYFGGRTFQKYAVRAIPRPFLIDINGRIRSVMSPVDRRVLEELIRESADGVTGISPAELEWLVGVKVAPERVSFGSVSKGKEIQKSVYIYKADDPTFTVDIASAPDKPATAELLRYEEKGALLYELRVLLKADLRGENYASQVKLTTNDTRTLEIVILVKASIISEEP